MKPLAPVVVLLAMSLVAVQAATAKQPKPRSPRLEKLAINRADALKAKNATVHLDDLVSGWKSEPANTDDGSDPDCSWQDFSSYTITGQDERDFSQGAAAIASIVEVYPSSAQALGDFRVGTRKGTAACAGAAFARATGKPAKLLSAKPVAVPKVGDHAAAYRFVVQYGVNKLYADVIVFVRDRSIGAVFTINPGSPIGGTEALLRLMDQRLTPAGVA